MVKIGILGAGRIGKLHATNLQNSVSETKVVRIADPFMNDAMKDWAASIGVENITNNPDDVFNDPDVDAVFICSSTDTHADFIIKAAKAGKSKISPFMRRKPKNRATIATDKLAKKSSAKVESMAIRKAPMVSLRKSSDVR